jgi:Heparinase II/III-like protein/Heparinase II/III N-terminus/Polysaccharide deacetylase
MAYLAGEALVALAVLTVFCLKITSYADPSAFRPPVIAGAVSGAFRNTVSAISNLPFLNNCPGGLRMAEVPGGYVCAPPSVTGRYPEIYSSYPLVGGGREDIYSSTDEGTLAAASALLRNVYDLPRYPPVRLPASPTWSENNFSAAYWRFEFYSLRPTLNLLYAFRSTGNTAYARRLTGLDLSFIAAEPHSRWAWRDPHAVAFRCMSLIDTWWKLRQAHVLGEQASTAILRELEKTGAFLADPNHYQVGENHGTNEAAALYNLAVAFPALPHAHQWLLLARRRIDWQLKGLIDADGQLIENSPYYDFYTLEKLWQIDQYMIAQGQQRPAGFAAALSSMINFATYILQPDSQVPLLGSSLEQTINYHGVYVDMAATSPGFLYVLTHGYRGTAPPVASKFFPASALTIMRSGWPNGSAYPASTYLTFNIGRYRTAHSHPDAMGVTLYGAGGDLLPGPGLFTYAPGRYHGYFHGTTSENTVTVDGKSQFQGNGEPGNLVTRDGVTYQSAESSLYAGVQHRRLVMLLGAGHVLVVDQLHSGSVHAYRQMFHLFPSARLHRSGLTITGTGGVPHREITIQQLEPRGLSAGTVIGQRGRHPAGLCSVRYGRLEPCYQISYLARGRDATFVTLLTVGRPRQGGFGIAAHGSQLDVTLGGRHLDIALGHSRTAPPRSWATGPVPPPVRSVAVTAATAPANWTASGGTLVRQAPGGMAGQTVSLTPAGTSAAAMTDDRIRLDLRRHGARLAIRVTGLARVSDLELSLSNHHWARSVTTDLLNGYPRDVSGQWAYFFLGPGGRYGAEGGWRASAPGFDWRSVDGIGVRVQTHAGAGPAPVVSAGGLTLLPPQRRGKVVIIFDDGYQSILPAAAYLHRNGMPGNIAVIGKYVDYPTQDYLNLFQLRSLQDNWGWNMVNHTQQHLDAVQEYFHRHDLTGYANDILQQAAWLEANGLNSAPDWFIYPHGAANRAIQKVVGRYYMFARGITDNPDAYPFGNREDVNDFEIQYPGDGESGVTGYTSPAAILAAVRSAKRYDTTLILTFHRIHSGRSDPPGYPLRLFEQVVNGIRASGIRVMTLSQLDRSNGIPVTNRIHYTPGRRSLITVKISG